MQSAEFHTFCPAWPPGQSKAGAELSPETASSDMRSSSCVLYKCWDPGSPKPAEEYLQTRASRNSSSNLGTSQSSSKSMSWMKFEPNRSFHESCPSKSHPNRLHDISLSARTKHLGNISVKTLRRDRACHPPKATWPVPPHPSPIPSPCLTCLPS